MAAKRDAVESLRKETECSFCCDTMKSPKALPCLHNFCLECLNKYAARKRREGRTTFNCPECSKLFPLPEGDRFDAFQTAFQVNRLIDIAAAMAPEGASNVPRGTKRCDNCGDDACVFCFECKLCLCRPCIEKHDRVKANRADLLVPLHEGTTGKGRKKSSHPFCPQHGKKELLTIYCEDCRTCVCKKCRRGKHRSHRTADIEYTRDLLKDEISQAVDKMKARLSECREEFEVQDKDLNESMAQIQSSREKLQTQVEELVQVLREHEAKVLRELGELHRPQQEAQRLHKGEYELHSAQLKTYIDQAAAVLETEDDAEIVQTHAAVTSGQCAALTDYSRNNTTAGSNRLCVDYLPRKESSDTVRGLSLGRLNRYRRTDPSRCTAEGEGLRKIQWPPIDGRFTVKTRDAEGNSSYWLDDQVTVDTTADSGQDLRFETQITDGKDGTYFVRITPDFLALTFMDHFNVSVKVNGQLLAGSPYKVQKSYFQLGVALLMIIISMFVGMLSNPDHSTRKA